SMTVRGVGRTLQWTVDASRGGASTGGARLRRVEIRPASTGSIRSLSASSGPTCPEFQGDPSGPNRPISELERGPHQCPTSCHGRNLSNLAGLYLSRVHPEGHAKRGGNHQSRGDAD